MMKKISSILTVCALLGLTTQTILDKENENLAKANFKSLYDKKTLKQRERPGEDQVTLVHIVPHSYN